MRVVYFLLIPMLLLSFGTQAAEAEKPAEKSAEKSAPPSTEKTGDATADKILGPVEISEQMSIVWCEKLAECTSGEEMGPKECRKVLKKSFQEGFKNIPQGQKVEVKSSGLTQCSENIKKDTCDSLKSAQTLPGCEFISLLNRS